MKKLLMALAVIALVVPVAASGLPNDPAPTPPTATEGMVIQADYVGPLFDGEVPTIEEGDSFQTVVGNSGTGSYEVVWEVNGEDGLPALLSTQELDQIRLRVGGLLGGTGGAYAYDDDPDYSCGIFIPRPTVTEDEAEATVEGTCWLADDEDVRLEHRVWGGLLRPVIWPHYVPVSSNYSYPWSQEDDDAEVTADRSCSTDDSTRWKTRGRSEVRFIPGSGTNEHPWVRSGYTRGPCDV